MKEFRKVNNFCTENMTSQEKNIIFCLQSNLEDDQVCPLPLMSVSIVWKLEAEKLGRKLRRGNFEGPSRLCNGRELHMSTENRSSREDTLIYM